MSCSGKEQCPCQKQKQIVTRENLAVLLALIFIAISWALNVWIERRAPTIFEVAFAVTAVAALSVKPIYFFSLIRRVLK